MKTFTGRALSVLLVAALAAPVAWAGPREEVLAAFAKAMDASSYQARMSSGGARPMDGEMTFVAPDRYRMRMPELGEQTVIGDTMYMTMQGRTMQVPLPAGTLSQWRDPAQLQANSESMMVAAQGEETIDGERARKYRVEHTRPQPSTMTLWVGDDGYPLRIESGGDGGESISIRYSRFNDPDLSIDVPQAD